MTNLVPAALGERTARGARLWRKLVGAWPVDADGRRDADHEWAYEVAVGDTARTLRRGAEPPFTSLLSPDEAGALTTNSGRWCPKRGRCTTRRGPGRRRR
jgi:hypothetical protein